MVNVSNESLSVRTTVCRMGGAPLAAQIAAWNADGCATGEVALTPLREAGGPWPLVIHTVGPVWNEK